MQALKKYSDDKGQAFFQLEDMEPLAAPGPGEIQVEIQSVGICTSDVHVLHGAMQMPDGNVVGHEFSGTVAAMGADVPDTFKSGQHVICELAVGACFNCPQCERGHYEFCVVKKPPGWASQGVYTKYINMPVHCVMPIDESIPFDVAALAEPMAICAYGIVERAEVSADDFTVIYGMGPIGLLSLILLQDIGMKNIVCVTPTRHGRQRFELAQQLGCEHVYDSSEDIPAIIDTLTKGMGADCVIDCSGAAPAINQGFDLLRKGGKFVALGIANDEAIPLAFNKALLKALHLVFSCTSSHNAWEITRGILERQTEKIASLVTHSLPLADWQQAYAAIEDRSAIKAVLRP